MGGAFALGLFSLLVLAEVIRNRRRIAALEVLPLDVPPVEGVPKSDMVLFGPAARQLDAEVGRRLWAWMSDRSVDAVDVVPPDLETEEALELLAVFTTESSRTTRAVSAGQAMARLGPGAMAAESPATALGVMTAFASEHLHSGRRAQALIVPGVHQVSHEPSARRAILAQRMGIVTLTHLIVQAFIMAWVIALTVTTPYGWVALLLFHVQPVMVFAGTRLWPKDIVPMVLVRLPRYALRWWRAAVQVDGRRQRIDSLRPVYEGLAKGGDRFFLPRDSSCPICGGQALTPHVSVSDLIMFKPGRFSLDRCGDCQHVFQNPRLSEQGLSYYYRDCYDGLGEGAIEQVFATAEGLYDERAQMVRGHLEPSAWLDVGTGHGHFCQSARRLWPDTRFEGLDMGDAVERGSERGWLDAAHSGMLHEHAPSLRDRFDVVSMFHYLEHTPDPVAQLKLASGLLKPGGMLMVEVPNPDSVWGKILGRFWLPWFQPQHLHFLSVDALSGALERAGMRVRKVDYLTTAGDLFCTAFVILRKFAPGKDVPWGHRSPGHLARLLSAVVWVVGSPILLFAVMIDAVVARAKPARYHSNAYRVLAERATPRNERTSR